MLPRAQGLINHGGNPRGRWRVGHREKILDIEASTAFSQNTIPVNPGLPGTFTWLALIAPAFESYKFHYLRFVYETNIGSNTDGQAFIMPEYDVNDPPPIDADVVLGTAGHLAVPIWTKRAVCHIDMKKGNRGSTGLWKKTRVGDVSGDNQSYDYCNISVGCLGTSHTPGSIIGRVWVEYDVEFFTPQMSNTEQVVASEMSEVCTLTPFVLGPAYATVGNMSINPNNNGKHFELNALTNQFNPTESGMYNFTTRCTASTAGGAGQGAPETVLFDVTAGTPIPFSGVISSYVVGAVASTLALVSTGIYYFDRTHRYALQARDTVAGIQTQLLQVQALWESA